MSRRKRRNFSTKFKTKVAFEAIQERKTLAELASQYGLAPSQISAWKKQDLESLPDVFGSSAALEREHEQLTASLYKKIGRLEMELDWLQKKPTRLRHEASRHD